MFRPRTSQISREDFLQADADLVIGDTGVQGVRGDAVHLIPTAGAPVPREFTWPVVTWSREDELRSFPGEIDNGWDANFNNLTITTPQLFEFDLASGFLDIATALGEHQYVYQREGGTPGKRYWSDNVNNALGWTLQMRLQVVDDDTGIAEGHQIVIDDGAHREVMTLRKNGISFLFNPGLDIAADLTFPRELRIGGRQDDIYVLLDNGQGVAGPNCFTGDTSIKELGFGIPTDSSGDLRTLFDYVHQYHGGIWIDDRPNVLRTYSTVGSTAVTQAYAPRKAVRRFDEALVDCSGDLAGGTTTVITEYRSSVTGDLWVQLSSTAIDVIGIKRISLAGIPVASHGTDEVRFKVDQVSSDGSAEPPAVESITVLTTFMEPGFRIVPRWGPTIGGSQHVIDLLPDAYQAQKFSATVDGMSFYAPLDADLIDLVGNITGSPAGTTAFDTDEYGIESAKLGAVAVSSSSLDTALASFVDAVPFGKIGAGLEALWTSGLLVLGQGSISRVEGGQLVSRTAQAVAAAAGNGVKVTGYASAGVLTLLLQISEGEVEILFNGISRVFDVHDYWTPRPVAITLTGTHDLEIKAKNANASFSVAFLSSMTRSTGSVTFVSPGQPTGEMAVDLNINPMTFEAGAFATRKTGNNGWEIGITAEGYPYATAGDGTTLESITGSVPMRTDAWQNLMMTRRVHPDHTGLQLYLDGQLVADSVSALSGVTAGTDMVLGGVPGLYDDVRIHSDSEDGLLFGVANGLANPSFETAYGAPRDAYNKLILRFAQTRGVFADDSGREHHAYLIHEWRAGLHRDQEVSGRPATLFWFNGAIGILHTPDLVQDLPIGIYARGFFRSVDHVQELASKWNAGGTIGWKVEILADGTVKVTVKDGSTHELTSDVALADDSEGAVHVEISSTGIVLRVAEVQKTLVEAISSIAAADQDLFVGKALASYLTEFVVRKGTLSYGDYLTWWGSTPTWTPTGDEILIDGTGVPNAQVLHYSPTRKYMALPPHVQGAVPIFVRSQGIVLGTERQFLYALTYKRPIDPAKLEKVPKIHSPFRIVPTVKRGGVNLALVQMPDISVDAHVSMHDLSYLAGENLSTYFGGIFPVVNPVTQTGYVDYTGQVDTDDLRVSNRSVMRRDVKEPTPLFYRYLIGRGRRYVYQENATGVADVGIIRQGIEVIDGDGQKLSFTRFPWDIEVSDKDVKVRQLPANTFAVSLFTAMSHIPEVSVRVRYTAADILNGYRLEPNFTEFVNSEPAMGRAEGVLGYDQFALELEGGGTYKLSVGTTGL